MIAPTLPSDDTERLAALHALKILDSPAEERFERIVRIAQGLFGVPIVAISLVDDDREWLKACRGTAGNEGPRDASFCGHAILSDEPLVVEDALADLRFADNPQVVHDGIRFTPERRSTPPPASASARSV